jgi:hypothetical protein
MEDRGPETFPCPCCGHLVFDEPPGSHQRCPVCLWEDNLVQLRFPTMPGGANSVSLEEAQANYQSCGAAERRNRSLARSPLKEEGREAGWRPLDPARDNIELPERGVPYGDSYPERDTTVLYYWRASYWRRLTS